MKKTLAILAFIVLAVPAFAQTNNADAEYLNRRTVYTLNSDGSSTMTYSHQLKINTPFAFNRAYGESFIVYNPEWQSLKITKSVTKMTDGRDVESPYNAYNEVLPAFAHNIAPYHKLREMVVTHTGLEPGAVITFEYTLTTKPGFMPGLMDRVLLAQRSPIKEQEVVVRIPKGKTLKFEVTGSPRTIPAKTSEGEYEVYSWRFTDIPLVAVEDHQPALWQFAPSLMFSTAEGVELAQHIMPDQTGIELDPTTKATVRTVISGLDGDVPKALALQKFMLERVAIMHGGMEHTGYKPLHAQETWNRAAGSALDAAVLLAAMCRNVGVEAVPALVSDSRSESGGAGADMMASSTGGTNPGPLGYPAAGGVPCLQQFSTGAVLVPNGEGGYTLLNASGTQHTAKPLELNQAYFLPISGPNDAMDAGQMAVNIPLRNSRIETKSDWSIKDDGTVHGRSAAEATGAFASDLNPDAMGKAVAGALKSAGWGLTAETESASAMGAGASKCEVKVESKSAPAMDGFMRFALPGYGHLASKRVKTTSAPRQTPVDFDVPFAEEHLMTLHYPSGMKPVALPEKVEIQNAAGSIRSIFIDHGEDIEIIRSINLPAVVPLEHYEDLKAIMNVWNDPARNAVVFEKK